MERCIVAIAVVASYYAFVMLAREVTDMLRQAVYGAGLSNLVCI